VTEIGEARTRYQTHITAADNRNSHDHIPVEEARSGR